MKKSQISFKIKNEKNYDSIRFVGGSLSLKDLKNKIKEKLQDKNAGPSKEKDKDKNKDDILIYDELTKQLITEDTTLIASDKKVVIERVSAPPVPSSYRQPVVVPAPRNDRSEFVCKLCRLQFTNPTLTRCCGETACEPCLDKSIKQKSECPFCKKKVLSPSSFKAGPNTKIQELMQKHLMQNRTQAPPPQVTSFPNYNYPNANPIGDYKQLPFKEIEKYLVPGTKYFIIKSSNFENLELSIKHSEWATTKNNETKLNNAFSRSKNVILIFSVNKSSQFQGYARMESPSSNKINSWQGQESIRLGGTFKVVWLRVCNVNFARVSNLKNRFNNHEPIKKSRDTQEIPEEIGLEICKMFEVPDKDNNYYPISDDRRKYMYYYNPGAPVPTSPMNQGNEPISQDSGDQSENKTPTPRPLSEDGRSELEKGEMERMEEHKKEEQRVDLLADLDLDEPIYFNTEADDHGKNDVKEAETSQSKCREDLLYEDMTEDPVLDRQSSLNEQGQDLADQPLSLNDQQIQSRNGDDFEAQPENAESMQDFKSDMDNKMQEDSKFNENFEEERSNRYSPDDQSQKQESRHKSPSQEKMLEEDKNKKVYKPPAEPQKLPPSVPQMPYPTDPYMGRPQEPVPRPHFMMDNRPPPPPTGMYPQAPPQMRPGYPPGYQPNPYANYPMGQYPGMPPPMQPGMNNPYYYNYYQPMWNPAGNRPFPFDNKMKPGGFGPEETQSQSSEGSDSSRKRDKKKSKKDKKKKKRSSSKDRSREREREKDKDKDKERERDRERSRDKSKSKSRRK